LHHHHLDEYKGNYDYYVQKKEEARLRTALAPSTETITQTQSEVKLDWKQQKEEQARLRKQANQIKKLEKQIEELEEQSSALDEELALPENASNSAKLMELTTQKAEIDEKLMELYEEWENISE
jgi:ATP-binding cassette subfamily F protein 3